MKYISILCFVLPFFTLSQNLKMVKGDQKFANMAYLEAIEAYEHFLSKDGDSSIVASKLGKSYLKVGNTNKALAWYDFLEAKGMMNRDQHLDYALLKRKVEDYGGSALILHGYESKFGPNDISQRLLQENESLIEQKKYENNFIIKKDPINTESSDIGISFINDKKVLVTSAKRFTNLTDNRYAWNNTNFYSVCVSEISPENELGSYKQLSGDVNTKYHDGPASLDTVNNWLYFTRDNFIAGKLGTDSSKTTRLKIYRGKYEAETVTQVEELNFNSDNYSCGHPALSADGSKMYFVSDMPGGFGGTDLYSVTIDSLGAVGEPINMGGEVNSSLNEMFPYYHTADNLLFFSSNGLPGYGGLDVFVAKLGDNQQVSSVSNIGPGINSSSDDFSFIINSAQTSGFFCSNRGLDIGDDDIYSFKQLNKIGNRSLGKDYVSEEITKDTLPSGPVFIVDGDTVKELISSEEDSYKTAVDSLESNKIQAVPNEEDKMAYREDERITKYFRLVGKVLDRKSNEPIEGVSIAVTETAGSDYKNKFKSGPEGGFKSDRIKALAEGDNVVFNFRLKKSNYVNENYELRTTLTNDSIIDITTYLQLELTEIEVGETDLASIININPIYFDFDKYNIRADAAIELDKIVQVMMDNPGIKIELGSHTDTRGSDEYNRVLSDKRAKSSAAYIISKGISKDRIYGKGYGETKLVVTDAKINLYSSKAEQERLHQLNRRTEFIIVDFDDNLDDSDNEIINSTTIKNKDLELD